MNDIFLKACRKEKVPYTPVWIMRQAGRYMKEYRDIREKYSFITLCKNPDLAAEVTITPVKRLGVDAAILFSDILILAEAMGLDISFNEKDGPQIKNPVRDKLSVDALSVPDPEDKVPFVMETIRVLRKILADDIPLIGFSGAPFTLASYMVEGGTSRNFIIIKRMMYQNPSLYHTLLDKITRSVTLYISAQITAGAQAIQLFDTWAGILSPEDYRDFALPYTKAIIEEVRGKGAPIILYINGVCGLLELMKVAGPDVISLDWRIDLDKAIDIIGKDIAVQGNLDPCALFLPPEKIEDRVKDILNRSTNASGHIFNLGHGILPETPVENVIKMVEAVHKFSKRPKTQDT
jgi:uroporphyrinogen decarboxylase